MVPIAFRGVCTTMNQYKILSILGSGAFGDVVKAQHMVSGEIVRPPRTAGPFAFKA